MITIQFSDSPRGGELGIYGVPKDLCVVQQSILALLRSQEQQSCVVEAEMVDPYPYSTCLDTLQIQKSNGLIRVWISRKSLHIAGKPENLEILASWFEFDEDSKPGYHHHFDYLGNEWWIDTDSIPLVIGVPIKRQMT